MSKEMIISVNGREKKIAILDNGRVTEFYIERGEENTGVVGNIYKGRVMRVLPGMQSAFVDIGLERDAFLYVSDFFDEEEEIERIVMEKGKKTSKDDADPEVTEHIYTERLKREKQMEDAQEIAEPLAESGVEIESEDKTEEEPPEEPKGTRGKSRRGKKGKPKQEVQEDKSEKTRKDKTEEAKEEKSRTSKETDDKTEDKIEDKTEEYTPVFEFEDSGFERVIDDEDTGDMFKDAYMQEAIFDKVRAVEFDMESTGTAEVGSLINSVSDEKNGFQRIADEDETEEEKPKKSSRSRSRRSKKKTDSAEATETEEKQTSKSSTAKKSSSKKSSGDKTAETEEEKPKKSSRSRSRKSSAKTKKETAEETRLMPRQASANLIRLRKWQCGAAVAADGAAVADQAIKPMILLKNQIRATILRRKMSRRRNLNPASETIAREAAAGATVRSRRSPICSAKVRKF